MKHALKRMFHQKEASPISNSATLTKRRATATSPDRRTRKERNSNEAMCGSKQPAGSLTHEESGNQNLNTPRERAHSTPLPHPFTQEKDVEQTTTAHSSSYSSKCGSLAAPPNNSRFKPITPRFRNAQTAGQDEYLPLIDPPIVHKVRPPPTTSLSPKKDLHGKGNACLTDSLEERLRDGLVRVRTAVFDREEEDEQARCSEEIAVGRRCIVNT